MLQNRKNLAFKCTWNDAGFRGICSQEIYEHNLSRNRAWCTKSSCRTFKGVPSEKDHPCYESILFTAWRFGAGWDHKNVKRPRVIREARIGKIALLTTLEPERKEEERRIIGFMRIRTIDQGQERETIVHGDPAGSLELDASINVKFWDYYLNPNAPTKSSWNTGLFRYVEDKEILSFLRDLEKKYIEKGLSRQDIIIIEENIRAYGDSSLANVEEMQHEIKGRACPKCGFLNLEQAKFCNQCGQGLPARCSICETLNPSKSKYCFECGTRLGREVQCNLTAIKNKLLDFGRSQPKDSRSWIFTDEPDAEKLVQEDSNAFLFGVIFDQGIDAERAWKAPYELRKRMGTLDPSLIARMSAEEIENHFEREPRLHRFWRTMARRIKTACVLIEAKYGGDATKIWPDGILARDLYNRLIEFDGIGQKKASMAVNILFRDMGAKIGDKSGIDVSYDEMVRRTFLRLGLAKKDTLKEIITAARRLNPQYPGELDHPAWLVGRNYCLRSKPKCSECFLDDVCPKLGIKKKGEEWALTFTDLRGDATREGRGKFADVRGKGSTIVWIGRSPKVSTSRAKEGAVIKPHEGELTLKHDFDTAYEWLKREGEVQLHTSAGTPFIAKVSVTQSGSHAGEPTIRFFQGGNEYARSYKCCWGHYYNCNRTRMGMYCQALDAVIGAN